MLWSQGCPWASDPPVSDCEWLGCHVCKANTLPTELHTQPVYINFHRAILICVIDGTKLSTWNVIGLNLTLGHQKHCKDMFKELEKDFCLQFHSTMNYCLKWKDYIVVFQEGLSVLLLNNLHFNSSNKGIGVREIIMQEKTQLR